MDRIKLLLKKKSILLGWYLDLRRNVSAEAYSVYDC